VVAERVGEGFTDGLIILRGGGMKKGPHKEISMAETIWNEYKERNGDWNDYGGPDLKQAV
jgi:hypothetical protein